MAEPERVGDYILFPAFASGGTASIHPGRLVRAGFHRVVVVKRLHRAEANQPGAAEGLLREARLSSRIRSPYVVPTIDVIHAERELCLVMEFVQGVTLGRLLELAAEQGDKLPLPVVVTIFGDVLRGLHAAHAATNEDGTPLHVIHRDVTPRNIIIGTDGLARMLDFGIAKALGQRSLLTTGDVRGTIAYMAPELLRGDRNITKQADMYSAGVVLWEALTGERFGGRDGAVIVKDEWLRTPPSSQRPEIPASLDNVVLGALRAQPLDRTASAEGMALDLEAALAPAPREEVVRIVETLAFDELERMRELVRACERHDPNTVIDRSSVPPTRVSAAPPNGSTTGALTRELPGASSDVPVLSEKRSARNTVLAVGAIAAIAVGVAVTQRATPGSAPAPSAAPTLAPPPPTAAVTNTTEAVTPSASKTVEPAPATSFARTSPAAKVGGRKPPRDTGAKSAPATPAPGPATAPAAPAVEKPPTPTTTPPPTPATTPPATQDPASDRM